MGVCCQSEKDEHLVNLDKVHNRIPVMYDNTLNTEGSDGQTYSAEYIIRIVRA